MYTNNKGGQDTDAQSGGEQARQAQASQAPTAPAPAQIRERVKRMTTKNTIGERARNVRAKNTQHTKARKAVSVFVAILMVAVMIPVASFATENAGGGALIV